ncbi:MAG TPA: prolipoprotein diacylglyceryl transferase family protein [Tepidisphaeraceae bacterium]|jgi:phosphatidylglycerol:prolipoprotein diacylglycerol transferase
MWQTILRIPIPQFLQNAFGFSPTLPLYGYGLMLVIAFLLATELAKFISRRVGINPEHFINAGLIALITGVIGARTSHILENLRDYTDPSRSIWGNFKAMIDLSSGGLTYYGGVLLATPCTLAYAFYKKVPLRLGMDIVAPCLMVGLGIGRVGCFLNGCCYGAGVQTPISMQFPYPSPAYLDDQSYSLAPAPEDIILRVPGYESRVLLVNELLEIETVHARLASEGHDAVLAELQSRGGLFANPTYANAYLDHAAQYGGEDLVALAKQQHSAPHIPAQLLTTITCLLIALVLFAYFPFPHAPGRVFALMLMIEGTTRYLLEMIRVEPPVTQMFGHGLSFSMVLALFLVPTGIILWFVFGFLDRQRMPAQLSPA